MTDAISPVLPAAPRPVPWRAVLASGVELLAAGAVVVAAGLVWIAARGAPLRGMVSAAHNQATLPTGVLILPGLVLMGLWLRGVVRTRQLLGDGAVAPAELEFQQALLRPWPRRLLVGGTFADHDGRRHRVRAVVPARGLTGIAVRSGGRGLLAVYDPGRPERCRLLVAAELGAGAR